jgi:hypothetical protein
MIAKSMTSSQEGKTTVTKVDNSYEILGYFGYRDSDKCVMGIGLIVVDHS